MSKRTPWTIDDDGFLVRSDDETASAYDLKDAAALLNTMESSQHDHVGLIENYRATLQSMEAQREALRSANRALRSLVERFVFMSPVMERDALMAEARAALARIDGKGGA
jgi:hypothetical protein